jgi:predicted membrane chloride channel (bestrophin family)
MWGLMLNRSRDLVRQAVTFYPADDMLGKANLARWTMAFSLSLKVHLQPAYELEDRMAGVLSEREVALLKAADHKPNAVMQVLPPVPTVTS